MPDSQATEKKTDYTMALRNVKRAGKLLRNKDWQADPQAQYLVESANVYAMLEIADAIREATANS